MKRSRMIKRRRLLFIRIVFVLVVLLLLKAFVFKVSAKETTPKAKYYTSVLVMQGDTVNSIGSRYISSEYSDIEEYVDEVRQMNYLSYDCQIHTGDYIVVPYYDTVEDEI